MHLPVLALHGIVPPTSFRTDGVLGEEGFEIPTHGSGEDVLAPLLFVSLWCCDRRKLVGSLASGCRGNNGESSGCCSASSRRLAGPGGSSEPFMASSFSLCNAIQLMCR